MADPQIERLTADQPIRRIVEHGAQIVDVPLQLGIDHSVAAGGQNGVDADLIVVLGKHRVGDALEEEKRAKQQGVEKSKPHFVHVPHRSLHCTREWSGAYSGFQRS
ncbi:hypothetical protein DESC_290160 [Desulfosarcina cetonica]|nr:hypothetical protein DESC_290160 [Desulfosarcina cetonica]